MSEQETLRCDCGWEVTYYAGEPRERKAAEDKAKRHLEAHMKRNGGWAK